MPDTDFEEGIYTIANFKTPAMVMDAKDGKAISRQFIASESQQWELVKMYNVAYAIRNVATQRYLGMSLDDPVKDRYELREVEHVFPWHLKRRPVISIYVPYTPYLVSLDQSPASSTNLLQQDQGQAFGKWYFCKVGCFAVDAGSEKQKFVATKTETGWAFRNVETKRFLGLPVCVVLLKDGIRLPMVDHESTWVVVPHHEDTSKFKLWIPFTSRVMDLHWGQALNDHPIHMCSSGDANWQWWRFELLSSEWESNELGAESAPGEPEKRG
ncbi:hypothetical protein BKA70DRAFT_1563309 [Coprinopsis sp. MPI-PUGE-AT-0042]|nr:hypothetical protein BKA70DRAFT_1563309 [Coprinopsis sp. MPI-PUGE-AT-0042]